MLEFVQYTVPDANALREQINKVKGDRSMVKFADDIKISSPNVKVSAPTLSRACNWSEGKPVSIELLEAIAKIADKDSGVTLETLAAANGMRTQEEDSKLSKRGSLARRRESIEYIENSVRMIIQNEIMCRDFPVQKLSGLYNWYSLHGYMYQKDRVFPRNFTFGYSVSGMSPCSTWKFALDQMELPEDSNHNAVEAHVGNFINKVGAVFASDSFESELYEGEKYSFIFIDHKLYETFLKRLEKYHLMVNGLMTAILIDLEGNRVVDETQLTRYDGAEASSFFKIPVSRMENEEDVELTLPYDMVED